jgi:hypothetical protein
MMEQRAQLKDMLSYEADTYYSEDEIGLIRRTFKDNNELIKVIRKTFLPTISDPELPLEEFQKDWMINGKSWTQIPESERASMVLARQEAIEFIVGGLIMLKNLANIKEESPQEKSNRREKDSSK